MFRTLRAIVPRLWLCQYSPLVSLRFQDSLKQAQTGCKTDIGVQAIKTRTRLRKVSKLTNERQEAERGPRASLKSLISNRGKEAMDIIVDSRLAVS